MPSEDIFMTSWKCSVFIQNSENGDYDYVVRIFDQLDDPYTDYMVPKGELSDSILAQLEGFSKLSSYQFLEYLTSNLGHTQNEHSAGPLKKTINFMTGLKFCILKHRHLTIDFSH